MTGLIVDWEEWTGQSRFVIDLLTIPVFSAIAGLLTNWTGVWMLFAPVHFRGFHVPGLQVIYPYLPRRVQILPIFAAGGLLGFQGFIPARSEKMASLTVDLAIAKVGGPGDFYRQLEPQAIADQFARVISRDLRSLVDSVMASTYPQVWADLPPQLREMVYTRVRAELPRVSQRSFDAIGEHIDELLDVKSMVINHIRNNPGLMKDVCYSIGAPELRFMVWSGLLGFPMGLLLAVYLHLHTHVLGLAFPAWLVVLLGASLIGIIANIIAVRVVFTPADRKPWWKCVWRQALLARRQQEAAADFGHSIAYDIITMDTIVDFLTTGPNKDKTRALMESVLVEEIDRALGVIQPFVRVTVGAKRWDAIREGSTTAAFDYVPAMVDDEEFRQSQAEKVDRLCTQKLQELPPKDFVHLLYSAIEQDAWLLYLHGGLLGFVVGGVHLAVFGA